MTSLSRRIGQLERAAPDVLSPRIRKWLGWPLTDAELRAAEVEGFDDAEIDAAKFSPEVRAWLGV